MLKTSVFESFMVTNLRYITVDNLLKYFTVPLTQHTVSFETKSPIITEETTALLGNYNNNNTYSMNDNNNHKQLFLEQQKSHRRDRSAVEM